MQNEQVPDEWTATRIATHLHRVIFAPLGFVRVGTACTRTDEHLIRTITFYARPAATPRIQLLMKVALVGLPEALTPHRRDSLWGYPKPENGSNWYPRPPRGDALPAGLLADVSGPSVEFLTYASTLSDFVEWAQQIYVGDQHRGWWRRFQPVLPQGTSPLQAGAYAATLMGNADLATQLADKVIADERNTDETGAFRTELARLPTAGIHAT